MLNEELHKKFVARQSIEELQRKAKKAKERSRLWTQEEIDFIERRAKIFADYFAEEYG